MNTLKKLLTNSRAAEINAVSTSIIDEFEKNDLSGDEHLSSIIDLLKTENGNLTGVIVPIKTKSCLMQKDKVRKENFRALNHLLKGYTYHPEAEIKTAAEKIYKIFKHFGIKILKESYATKGSLLEALLSDLSAGELQNDIDKLSGVRKLITALTAAGNDFNETWSEYNRAKVEEAQIECSTKTSRRVVSIINNKLVTYLRAMNQADEKNYGSFVSTISEIINDNNLYVKMRSKFKKPGKQTLTETGGGEAIKV